MKDNPEMLGAMPVGALAWLVLGGLLFTVGAVVDAAGKPDWFSDFTTVITVL